MAHSDFIYNRISNLLKCYIQYPYLEKGEQLVNLNWIIRNSHIQVPEDFNIYEYPVAVEYTKHKIVDALFHAFLPYFEGKDEGKYLFTAIHEFNGMKQQFQFTLLYEDLNFYISDINDNINPDEKFGFDFPHQIERPLFLDHQ